MDGGGTDGGATSDRPRGFRTKGAWLLALPFLALAQPTALAVSAGAALSVLGLLLRGWSAGIIRKDEALSTTGPYAHLRHPLYAGSFLIGIGLGVAGGHWIWPLLVTVFFVAVYHRTVAEEGERLTRLFGERYRSYAASVPAVLPRLRPYREAAGDAPSVGFAWRRYLRNREWEAPLGVFAAFALLAVKARLLG